MLYVYLEAKLAMVESPEPFNDENGNKVEYFINHLKTPDGEVLVVNSKASFEELEGKEGVFKLRARSVDDALRAGRGGMYRGLSKLTLAGFVEGETLPVID